MTLSLLAAGLCLTLISGAFYSYRGAGNRLNRFSAFLKTGTVNELVFTAGGNQVTLNAGQTAGKAGRSWSVVIDGQNFPAAQNKAERFFELASEAGISPPVTESRENWSLFALEDSAEKRIVFSGSAGKTEILLGKEEEAGRGQYIRVAGSDAVYLVSQSLSYYAEQESAYWSELRIFPSAPPVQDIVAMEAEGRVEIPSGAAVVSWSFYKDRKPEGVLWLVEGEPERNLDQAKVDSLAAVMSQINAKSFAPEAGTDDAGAVITLTAANQTRYELRIGRFAESGNYCWARVNGEPLPYAYFLDSALVERITVPLAGLEAARN
jgi:hypothetical protein